MENLINWEQIQKNELLLKTHIFTARQLEVLKKKLQNKKLNSTEKTYYYKFIKPKLKALLSFSEIEETNIRGKESILSERLSQAKRILKQMQKKYRRAKIMISGSFLFNKEYNDIDIFILSKYKKEDYRWKKVHVNFLPEEALNSLFFASLSQISLNNFKSDIIKEFKIELKDLLQNYEILINKILNKENYQKELRNFILKLEYLSKNHILNPQELYEFRIKLSKENILKLLQKYFSENLALIYSKKELKLLNWYILDYQKLNKEYKQSYNLQYYIKTYQEALEIAI